MLSITASSELETEYVFKIDDEVAQIALLDRGEGGGDCAEGVVEDGGGGEAEAADYQFWVIADLIWGSGDTAEGSSRVYEYGKGQGLSGWVVYGIGRGDLLGGTEGGTGLHAIAFGVYIEWIWVVGVGVVGCGAVWVTAGNEGRGGEVVGDGAEDVVGVAGGGEVDHCDDSE